MSRPPRTRPCASLVLTFIDGSSPQAAAVLAARIQSVTPYSNAQHRAEIVAKVENLIAAATNENAAPKGGVSNRAERVQNARIPPRQRVGFGYIVGILMRNASE